MGSLVHVHGMWTPWVNIVKALDLTKSTISYSAYSRLKVEPLQVGSYTDSLSTPRN